MDNKILHDCVSALLSELEILRTELINSSIKLSEGDTPAAAKNFNLASAALDRMVEYREESQNKNRFLQEISKVNKSE